MSEADPGFHVRGGGLKKIAPSGGRREHFWGISCEKNHDFTPIFFSQLYGGGGGEPPGSVPGASIQKLINIGRRKLVEILVLILKK